MLTARRGRRLLLPLLSLALAFATGCSAAPTAASTAAARGLVKAAATAPSQLMVPDYLPAGFTPGSFTLGQESEYLQENGLLLGEPDASSVLDGPSALVGSSSASSQMASPVGSGGQEKGIVVPELAKDGDWLEPRLIEDGPWTWLVFANGCQTDCISYVVGREMSDEDLISLAKGVSFDSATPSVAPESVPTFLKPIVLGDGGNDITAAMATRLTYRGPGYDDLIVEFVQADPSLASLWGFWVDGTSSVAINGHAARGGSIGATEKSAGQQALVWAQDGLVISVRGDTSAAEIAKVAASLRVASNAELEQLQMAVVDKQPSWSEAGCIEPDGVILSQQVGIHRWIVCFDIEPGSPWFTVGWLTGTGGGGGGISGTLELAPGGKISMQSMDSCSPDPTDPPKGTMVFGSAPPDTSTLEISANGSAPAKALLATTGARTGERWFAVNIERTCMTNDPAALVTITAKNAAGAVIATV